MLLTNWLGTLTSRIQKRRVFRSRDRRNIRQRWQSVVNNQISTTEVLEDRTLLTTFFVDDDFSGLSNGDNIVGTDTDPIAPGDQNAIFGTTAFDTIQAAVTAAVAGDTINIAAGTYVEDVIVDTSVILQGANAGIAAGVDPGVRGLESELTGGFRLFANDVVIDGLKIVDGTGPAGIGDITAVFMTAGTSGHTIENSILEGPGTGVSSRGVLSTFNGNNDNITIQNNEIYNWVSGIFNQGNTNVDIFGNNIHDVVVGIANDFVADVSIEGNAFSNASGGVGVFNNTSNGVSDVAVHNNFFDSSTLSELIGHHGGDAIDASGNWWGGTDETTIANSMKSGGVAGDASMVDFTSFLNVGTDTDGGTAGFQGDFSTLNVTTLGSQTGLAGRIQEAIDSVTSGGTVNILAGTYNENTNVNKSVTLNGAGTGSTIIDNAGNLFIVSADDVTFQNMTLQNGSQGIRAHLPAGTIDNLLVDDVEFIGNSSRGIEIHNDTLMTNMTVSNSLFQNNGSGIRFASSAVGDGVYITDSVFDGGSLGFYQANDGSTGNVRDVQITGSTFRNFTHTAVFAEEIRDSTVDDNIFEDNHRDFTLFKAYTGAGTVVENLQITNNTMTDSMDTSIIIFVTGSGLAGTVDISGNTINSDVGVMDATVGKIQTYLDSNFTHAPININENDITFSGTFGAGATAVHGIQLRGASDQINIERNTIDGGNVGNAGGTPQSSGVFVRTNDGTVGAVSASAVINVSNNSITGFDNAVSVYDNVGAAFGALTAGAQLNVNGNTLAGNTLGVVSGAGETVNASNNWWGSSAEATIAALMTGPVDFTSFLDVGTDTDGVTAGFQGDFSVLNVTALGSQTGPTGRIQEAIDSVSSGGTVNILAGTYAGDVDATGNNVTLAPGNSPGQVTMNGNLTLDADDTLDIEINGILAGTDFDQLVVNGTVDLGGATLNLIDGFDPAEGNQFVIIDNDSTDPVTGTFNGLSEGHEFTDFLGVIGQSAFLTYAGGDGNDVAIVVENSTPQVDLPVDGNPDAYTIALVGGNVVITDDATGDVISNTPLAALGGPLVINGEDNQDDTLTFDLSGIDENTGLEIVFNGGVGGNDEMTLISTDTLTSLDHIFQTPNDGLIFINGQISPIITYTGLEPVTDNLVVANRTFTFIGATETITLSDDGNLGDGFSFIDSDLSESVVFIHPTNSLTIRTEALGGSGADIININGIDSTFDQDLIVLAGTDDTINTAAVDIGSGLLDLTADQVNVNGAFTTTGTVDIESTAQDITFGAAGSIDAGASDIDLTAFFNVESVNVTTTSEVRVTATGGGINDLTGNALITADRVALRVGGPGGITGLETDVNTLAASSAGGGFIIDNPGDLEIGTVDGLSGITANASTVFLTTTGSLTVNDAVSAGTNVLRTLDSASAGQDINVNADITSTSGDILLETGDNLNLATGVTLDAASALNINIDFLDFDAVGGIANLNGDLIAGTQITVTGNTDDDQVIIDGNGGATNDGGTVDGIQSLFSFVGGGGTDELIVDDSGDVTGDTILVQSLFPGSGAVIGATGVTLGFETLENLTLFAGTDADDITVSPNVLTAIDIFGGDPTIAPGDTLTYLTPPGETSTLTTDGPDGGTIEATGGFQDVVYDEIEGLTFGGSVAVNGTSGDDVLVITATSADSGTYQINGGAIINFNAATDFTFNGDDGDDILRIINPGGGLFDPTGGIFFNGQGNTAVGDSLEILGGTATNVEHRFTTENDGSVFYNGEGVATITYTGLEPVLDTIVATNRTFSFLGGAETITLSDDGVIGDGVSQIDSDNFGEVVAFLNATDSVTINTEAFGGSGVDAVNIEGLDSTFDADLTVNGGTDDTATFQTNATDLGSGDLTVDIGNVVLDQDVITTGNADLNASGGSITDGGSSAADALTTATAILTATVDVGGAVDAVDIDVANLEADAGGAINLNGVSGTTLTIGGISGLVGLQSVSVLALTTDADLQIDENITTTDSLIHLESSAGGITMLDGVVVNSGTDDTNLIADGDIDLSIIVGDEVRLTSNNGAILDNTGAEQVLIFADRVALRASTGIGTGDEIEVDVNTLAADSTAGVINIAESDGISIGTVDGLFGILGADAITLFVGGIATVDENIESTGAASPISFTSGFDITVNATIQSNGGTIDLLADRDLILGATSVIDTFSAAAVTLIADNDGFGGGSFTQAEGGVVNAWGGVLDVISTGDARIADLRSGGGTVLVESLSGAIIDNTASETALITGNEAALEAFADIGAGGPANIDTAVSTLAATTPNGNIQISNTGALEIGTVDGLVGVSAGLGMVNVSAASPLTVASNVTGAGDVTLTATDAAGPGDDLTINGGITVTSTGSNVILNSGDDFLLSLGGFVLALFGTIEINIDPITDGTGATVDLLGNVSATQTTINGGDDADTFNILPTADSPITVNGGDPTLPGPGDVLNLDFSGLAAAPFLTLGGAPGSGSFGFVAPDLEQTVDFTSIENVNSGGTPFHLVLDMFAAGFQNAADDTIDVQLDAAGTNLLIDVNASNIFSGAAADILSFTVIGSTDNETLNINESPGGLPLFDVAAPAIPGSNGSHLNNAADTLLEDQFNPTTYDADDITIHYDGGDGTDAINVNFTTAHNAAYFSDNIDSLGSGNIVAATPLGTDIDLGLSFGAVEGVGINGAGGGLRVDASSTPLTTTVNIDDDGAAGDGVSQITANGGFTNMVFSGFQGLQVVSGTGAELIDLIALDSATTVTQIELDADDVFAADDTANDTIRVRSTPAGVTDVNILTGLGNDQIQIFDAGNTVDNIFADITVDGEGGTDTLTIVDSGDATGDTFEVTSTTVDGLSSAAGTDVTLVNIDDLNVTGTDGNDVVEVNMTTPEDLNNVILNGFNGDDDFFLFNTTPASVDTRLNGDAGEDFFIFLGSNVLNGFIDGGGDADTLNYNAYSNAVHIALSGLGTIDGFQGRENNGSILGTGVASLGFDNIDDLIGSLGNDILEGPNLNNYWGITGTDEGFLIADRPNLMNGRPTTAGDAIATPPEQRIDFTMFENLIGGNQQDRFDVSDGAGLTGTLDGALGNDSLDYRDFTTGVTVDLFAGTATNIGGGLVAGTGGGDDDNSIENVFGGNGNDNITGDNDDNILGDGFGSDNLDGGGNGVGSENGGNDVFLMEPGAGGSQDVITDIHGNDTIDFRFASQGILFDVDIINTPQDVFGGNTIELRQIQPQQPDTNPSFMENIVGSEFNDIIFIDPLSQDGNFPIDGPPVLRSADGRGGIDVLDFDAKGQEVIDTGFSLTADGVGTVQYLNFENVRPFEDTPAFIVDDGDLGFSLGGDWPFHPGGTAAITNGIGFGDDVHSVREESPIGNGPAQAFWEFYGLTPGDYRISVTWPVSTNPTVVGQAATDAPYTIFDGARTDIGTAAVDLGTIDLNQQLEPDDFTADGTVWENLGVFTINSRTLTVMLTNLANGRITADAIRIERVSAGPEIELRDITDAPVPPTIIMDGHQGGINFGATELLTDAVRTFEITNQGSAPLNISNIVVPAGFTTNLVNQAIAPGNTIQFTLTMDSNTFGDRSGIFSFTTDDVDEETFNILLQGSVSNVIIIDDGDTDFSATAGFVSFPDAVNNGAGGFEGDVSGAVPNQPGSTPQPGAETATWTFTGLADGNYRVSTTWSTTPTATNRVDDAPFTLNGGGPIDVDQTVAPSSFVDANGVQWFDLDVSFSVIGGTLTVELTNDANSFPRDHFTLSNGVIADAVRIEYLPEPDIQVTVDGDVVEDDTGVVDFGSTLPGIPIIKTFTVTNLSADPVDVTGLIEFPPGFSIDPASPFGTDTTPVTINGGSSVTFTIQFDGGTTGSTFGQISFTTGDEDENPYNFTVMGEAGPSTVGVNDADFSTVGTWNELETGSQLDPEFLYAGDFFQGGTGANAATWTFDVEPGRYQVVANWYVNPNITTNGVGAASNAPYTIFDNGATVTTVAVDQRTSSDDFLDDGILWEFIGDPVQITSNTLSVQLSDNADGIVYADQIRIYRVVDPVIVVEVGSGLDTQEVADGGAVDFEETIVGAPVIRTFTITNFGERNMALGPISIPAGFSMVAPPGNTNLPPGASTTFSLQMNAATSGSFGGMVSFGVDSTDANPFNFMVSGSASASMIVDNGDLDYTNTGDPWETRTAQVAYIDYFQDDQDLLIGGDLPGVNTATWQFTNLGAGTYQVASHWFQHSNLAPNAQITISGIVGGPITVSLDQRFAPNDFSADGTNWEELGNFQVAAGGTLTVTMSDDGATGHLAADAMRLELIPVGLTAPEIEVRAGATNLTSGASSVDLGTSNFGSSLFQTFTITNTGTATLNLGAITPPAGFVVSTPLGTTALAAGQSTTFELEFNGATSTSGALTIANDDADENPFSFTVSATAVNSLIIDDGDAGFTSGGDYFASGAVAYRGFDSQKMNIGQTGTASWNFTGLVAGTYQVSATWDGHPLRDTGVDYNVTSSGVGGGAIAINQRIDPNDFNAEGSNWEILGTVTIGAGGSITVTLNDTAVDGSILADAIRIERTGPLQATSSVANSGAPVLTQADLNSVRDAALSYWTATGISAAELERLQSISFVLADLPDTMLGGATSTTIMIDINAAGHGWFVDDTPFDHSEFTEDADGGLSANEESDAFGRMDLLTVVLHEFGHTLGYADLDAEEAGHDLMSESLGESLRRLPVIEEAADTSDVDDFFSSIVDGDNPLLN
ncbi:golvesin C-terminal-like domain-containing protein [Gimesia aquarii]|uniref:Pectate lyase C n=1 Tax=Gimesia aquarii TaxID=2527964 RepID=A0A517W0N8_9PLAN|nr:choice-of-anchor D domain-containing protein [Gimesia aquarii]QDT98818.1 hypothetical protein V144x_43270 [Gimesia aquarii]